MASYWPKNANFPYPALGRPYLTLSPGMKPFEFLYEPLTPRIRVLGLFEGEDVVILACVVLTQCQRVTDRQMENLTIANTGLCI